MRDHLSKIISRDEAIKLIETEKSNHKTVVFTNGCFDVIHIGHVRTLISAKQLGDILIVGVNSDESVMELKGPKRPLMCVSDRSELLASLECVDYVIIFPETDVSTTVALLKPDIHVKGGDYSSDSLPEKDTVESYGGKVVVVPFIQGKSTTGLIEKIVDTYKT